MPVKLPLTANYNSIINQDLPFSDYVYNATLAANSDTSLTVPTISDLGGTNTSSTVNYLYARIRHTANNDIWFTLNKTAAVPGGASFALGSELLNNLDNTYKVKSGDVMHFITAASSASVSVAFYWQ